MLQLSTSVLERYNMLKSKCPTAHAIFVGMTNNKQIATLPGFGQLGHVISPRNNYVSVILKTHTRIFDLSACTQSRSTLRARLA